MKKLKPACKKRLKYGVLIVALLILTAISVQYYSNGQGWFSFGDVRYKGYKTFFSYVSDDVDRDRLPASLREDLQPYFDNNLYDVRYGYSNRAGDTGASAITDCYRIYFGGNKGARTIADIESGNFREDKSELKLLLHELTHTEQCYEYGKNKSYSYKRKKYAKKWFEEVATTWLRNPSDNIWRIHDAMPLEDNARDNANELIDEVYDVITESRVGGIRVN